MITYILIIALSTSLNHHSGTGAISQEFNSEKTCLAAGEALVAMAVKRESNILTWGCFKK